MSVHEFSRRIAISGETMLQMTFIDCFSGLFLQYQPSFYRTVSLLKNRRIEKNQSRAINLGIRSKMFSDYGRALCTF